MGNNKGIKILIVFLIGVIVGLGSYIAYEKINDKEEKNITSADDENEEKQIESKKFKHEWLNYINESDSVIIKVNYFEDLEKAGKEYFMSKIQINDFFKMLDTSKIEHNAITGIGGPEQLYPTIIYEKNGKQFEFHFTYSEFLFENSILDSELLSLLNNEYKFVKPNNELINQLNEKDLSDAKTFDFRNAKVQDYLQNNIINSNISFDIGY